MYFYLSIFWCIISSLPLVFFLYTVYLGFIRDSGGSFSGIFFLISFFPAMILLLINMIILVTRKENNI